MEKSYQTYLAVTYSMFALVALGSLYCLFADIPIESVDWNLSRIIPLVCILSICYAWARIAYLLSDKEKVFKKRLLELKAQLANLEQETGD